MKKLFYVIAAAILVSTNVFAQTTIDKVVDLNDTTAATKADRDLANKWLGKVGGIATYGANIEGAFDKDSTVTVWQLENVKSRDKAGASTQYLMMFTDKAGASTQYLMMFTDKGTKKPNARVTPEEPTGKVDGAIASGCGCFSIKQGDDNGEPVDPDLMK